MWLQDRPPGEDEQTWELSRFIPLLQEVLEDAAAGSLSADEYPHVRPPQSAHNGRLLRLDGNVNDHNYIMEMASYKNKARGYLPNFPLGVLRVFRSNYHA